MPPGRSWIIGKYCQTGQFSLKGQQGRVLSVAQSCHKTYPFTYRRYQSGVAIGEQKPYILPNLGNEQKYLLAFCPLSSMIKKGEQIVDSRSEIPADYS